MKNKFYFKTDEDKLLFEQELRNNIKILLGSSNTLLVNKFYEEVIDRLKSVSIIGWKDYSDKLNEDMPGLTDYSLDGYTTIDLYGYDNNPYDEEFLKRSFSHEIWHAIIVILCQTCMPDKEYRTEDLLVKNYSGFFNCTDSYNRIFTPGYLLNECIVDMLAIISNNLFHDGKYSIDDIFGFEFTDKYATGTYDYFLTFNQLLISAFNLDVRRGYQKNFDIGKGLLGYKVKSETGVELPANTFIDGLLQNPLKILEEFNKYLGDQIDYIDFVLAIDNVYFKFKNNMVYDYNVMLGIIGILTTFVNFRLIDYKEQGYISQGEYEFLLNNYNEVLTCFKEEIKAFKIVKSKKKFFKK